MDGRPTSIPLTLTSTIMFKKKNQNANLRAQCCTEHRSTPLWQQKQYPTCTYLVTSWVLRLLRLNLRLMGIWVHPGTSLCSVQRLKEIRNHKKCYGISGVMCDTYTTHCTYLSWKSLILSDISSLSANIPLCVLAVGQAVHIITIGVPTGSDQRYFQIKYWL